MYIYACPTFNTFGMTFRLLSVTLLLFLLSCQENRQQTSSVSAADTTIQSNTAIDNEAVTDEDDFIEPQYDEMKAEFLATYDKVQKIDSVFTFRSGQAYNLSLTYYCLKDSSVILPARYNWSGREEIFPTHPFVCEYKMSRAGETLAKGVIQKQTFSAQLDSALQAYGVLQYPHLSFNENRVEMAFSISVPLTDVGVGVTAYLQEDGLLKIE